MQQEILINWSPQETRVAVIDDGAVQEVHVERAVERGLVGNVYSGKVVRVLPGMQSAFVDVGLERAAFLHVADVLREPLQNDSLPSNRQPRPPIEKQVFVGQTLLVQVIKDSIGSKGARLSTQISIAGRALVFLPQDNHIGVSQKIPFNLRQDLRERVQRLASVGVADQKTGGFIVRTNGEDASDEMLAEDIAYLRKTWARIREASAHQPPTTMVHEDLTLLQRVLRDLAGEQTQAIQIDSNQQYTALRAFGEQFMPTMASRLVHYRGERPIFELYNVDKEIARALSRRVDLKSGGYLVIDQNEALTSIDVNTGAYVGLRSFDDTVFKTNLEAAHAIARQLRLRNLGGIVVVDFIDMSQPEHQKAVLVELTKQLARDRVKTHAGEFSALGLVEMTRKRTSESLAQRLSVACDQCHGVGRVRAPRTVAYDILREVLREARQFDPTEFRVVAAPAVTELLLDEESPWLAELSEFIGKPISVREDATIGADQYDIVLL